MTGIHYVTDEKGKKTAVLIDLKKHRLLWEDIQDVLVSQERDREKSAAYRKYRRSRKKKK